MSSTEDIGDTSGFTSTDESFDSSIPETESSNTANPEFKDEKPWKPPTILYVLLILVIVIVCLFFIFLIIFFFVYPSLKSEGDEMISLDFFDAVDTLNELRFPREVTNHLLKSGIPFYEARVDYYCCPKDGEERPQGNFEGCRRLLEDQELQIPSEDAQNQDTVIDAVRKLSTKIARFIPCTSEESVEVGVRSIVPLEYVYDCNGKCAPFPIESFIETNKGAFPGIRDALINSDMKEDDELREKMLAKTPEEQLEYVTELLKRWYESEFNYCYMRRMTGQFAFTPKEGATSEDMGGGFMMLIAADRQFFEEVMKPQCEDRAKDVKLTSPFGSEVVVSCTARNEDALCKPKRIYGGLTRLGTATRHTMEIFTDKGKTPTLSIPRGKIGGEMP